jgi:Zn finger protein HypA/HybF involved in hydrogenase expression
MAKPEFCETCDTYVEALNAVGDCPDCEAEDLRYRWEEFVNSVAYSHAAGYAD